MTVKCVRECMCVCVCVLGVLNLKSTGQGTHEKNLFFSVNSFPL